MGIFFPKNINYIIPFKNKFDIVKKNLKDHEILFFETINFPLEEALNIYNYDIIETKIVTTTIPSDFTKRDNYDVKKNRKYIYNNVELELLEFDNNYIKLNNSLTTQIENILDNDINILFKIISILGKMFYTTKTIDDYRFKKLVHYDKSETKTSLSTNTDKTYIYYLNEYLIHSLSNFLFKIISIAFEIIISKYEQIKNKNMYYELIDLMFTSQYNIDNQNNLLNRLNQFNIKTNKNIINNISEVDINIIDTIINEEARNVKIKCMLHDKIYYKYCNATNYHFYIDKFYLNNFFKYDSNNNNYYNIILDYITYDTHKYGFNFDIKFFYIEILESINLDSNYRTKCLHTTFGKSSTTCDMYSELITNKIIKLWYDNNSDCYKNKIIITIFTNMLLHFKKFKIKIHEKYNIILLFLFLNNNFTELFVKWYDYIQDILNNVDMYKQHINHVFNNNNNNNNIAKLILNKIFEIISVDKTPDSLEYLKLFFNIKTINSINIWYIPTCDDNNNDILEIKNLIIKIFDILVVQTNIINTIEFANFIKKYYPLYYIILKYYDINKIYENSNIYKTPTLFKIEQKVSLDKLRSRYCPEIAIWCSNFYCNDSKFKISRVDMIEN